MLKATFVFWTVVIIIILQSGLIASRGRGGGSRGGGSRGGGRSRSGSSRGSTRVSNGGGTRNVNSMIYRSNTYHTWAVRYHVNPSVRYAHSSPDVIHSAMMAGLILRRPRYGYSSYYDSSYYDKISICFNENPLYDRNVSQTPWFVCPWDDDDEGECCESGEGEMCCKPESNVLNNIIMVVSIIAMTSFCIYGIGTLYNRFCAAKKKESVSEEEHQINVVECGECVLGVYHTHDGVPVCPGTTSAPHDAPIPGDFLAGYSDCQPLYNIESGVNGSRPLESDPRTPSCPPLEAPKHDDLPPPFYDEVVNKTHVA